MAAKGNDNARDAYLDYIINNANQLVLTATEPADRAAALAGALASDTLTSGDFTKGAGDVSGRKVTVQSRTVTPTATGTASHLVILSATEILDITTISAEGSLTSGVDKSVPAYDCIELREKQ